MKKKNFKDKKLRDEVWEKTGWGKVASWYDNTVSAEKSTQKSLILPELLKFLPILETNNKRIIDLGCGTGFFLKEYFQGDTILMPAKSLGVDIDSELIELANQNLSEEVEQGKVGFIKSDATNLKGVGDNSFDVALAIESIVNMKDLKSFAKEAFRVLDKNGKLVVVVNHPSFRIPKSSDWYFNKENNKQGRVVYKYKTAHSIKIDMNPGTKKAADKIFTYTYHRPFEEYMNTFVKAGFVFSFMKEISSNKVSVGTKKKAEDDARSEIPMFLFLEFTRE